MATWDLIETLDDDFTADSDLAYEEEADSTPDEVESGKLDALVADIRQKYTGE